MSYVCLNNKTFEIEKNDNIIVPNKLGRIISILNKKGYYTKLFNQAGIGSSVMIEQLITSLIDNELIIVKNDNIKKIREIISFNFFESTFIAFKDNYKFENLPKGFKLMTNDLVCDLACDLEILKNNDNIEFKSIIELEDELNASIENLEKWAIDLPYLSN